MATTLSRCVLLGFAAALSAPAAPCQELTARSFFPKEWIGDAFVDMDRLQDTDLWDDASRSVAVRAGLSALRNETGVSLQHVRRLRVPFAWLEKDRGGRITPIFLVEGRRLRAPAADSDRPWDPQIELQIEEHRAVQFGNDDNEWRHPTIASLVGTELLVYGPKPVVEPALRGEHRPGVPGGELMAITATCRHLPAYVAMALRYDEDFLREATPMPFDWFLATDPPRAIVVSLDTGKDGAAAVVQMRLRFASGTAAIPHFEKKMREGIASLAEPPNAAPRGITDLLASLTYTAEDSDLIIELDLSAQGGLVNLFTGMVPMTLFAVRQEAQLMAAPVPAPVLIEIAEEVTEEEAAEEGKQPDKSGKKR